MTITLEEAWFNLANDLEQSVTLELSAEEEVTGKRATLQFYTQGRRRAVTKVGSKKTIDAEFSTCTRAQAEQLEDWIGEVVLYRSPRGKRIFCQFFDVPVTEIPGADTDIVNVSLTLHEITYDETV